MQGLLLLTAFISERVMLMARERLAGLQLSYIQLK